MWCREVPAWQRGRRGTWGGDGTGEAARMALNAGTTEAGRGLS